MWWANRVRPILTGQTGIVDGAGYSHPAVNVGRGRLLLAHDGTWPIDGDATAELKHKLAESLWWAFVLADRLDIDIDIDEAFVETMSTIRTNLEATIECTAP